LYFAFGTNRKILYYAFFILSSDFYTQKRIFFKEKESFGKTASLSLVACYKDLGLDHICV